MLRRPNTTRHGHGFSPAIIQAVWQKGIPIPHVDPNHSRRDRCGAVIHRNQHGNIRSPFGWEVDHEWPVAKGGSDDLSNLQPLQWQNNRHKADHWPRWSCAVGG